MVSLLWIPPRATGGVLFQVTSGIEGRPGANPLYRGVSEAVIAVEELDLAVFTYRAALGFAASDRRIRRTSRLQGGPADDALQR